MGGNAPSSAQDGDFSGAEEVARQHAGDHNEPGLFANALQYVQSARPQAGDIDEQGALQAHQQVYGQSASGGAAPVDSSAIGTAAAMQALKAMLGGGGNQSSAGTPM